MSPQFDPYHRWLGIPPEKQPPNHYALLAIEPFEDNPDVIESAADQRMSHLRNFQTGQHGRLSQTLLNEVAAAKICLLSPDRKAAYDRKLREQLQASRPPIAKAVHLASATLPAAQSPQEAAAMAVPQIEPGRTSVYAGRRRRRSWQAPVVLAVLALLVGVTAVAISIWGNPEPTVAERTDTDTSVRQLGAQGHLDGRKSSEPEKPQPPQPEGLPEKRAERLDPPATPAEPPSADRPPDEAPPAESTDEPGPNVAPTFADELGMSGPNEDPDVQRGEQPGDPPVSDERLAVADQARQAASERRIREIFHNDFAEAQTAETQLSLAERLFRQGDETLDNPVDRFVLFRIAVDLAAEGGDPELALDALDRIARLYKADLPAMKASALQKAVESRSTGSEAAEKILQAAHAAAEEAVADDDFHSAAALAKTAVSAARRTKDMALI